MAGVGYGDFPQGYGHIDYTQLIVDHVLKDVPEDLKGLLEDEVRARVSGGWASFHVLDLSDGIPEPPWKGDISWERFFEGKDVPAGLKDRIIGRFHEASLWLLQRSLMVLVLRHGLQQGEWDGTPEDLDFEWISGAALDLDMCLVDGTAICELRHAVQRGKLVLKVVSSLLW